MKLFLALFPLLFLFGCVSPEKKTQAPAPVYKLAWEVEKDSAKVLHADAPKWSAKVIEGVRRDLAIYSKASDRTAFCKNYDKLGDESRIRVWATMAVEMARYECGFKPGSKMTESDGNVSRGIFQLSYGDKYCPASISKGDLHDPLINIDCGMRIMSYHVGNDGVVAAGGYQKYGAAPAKGVARYWSVMRVPDRKSAHQKAKIQAVTQKVPGCN